MFSLVDEGKSDNGEIFHFDEDIAKRMTNGGTAVTSPDLEEWGV